MRLKPCPFCGSTDLTGPSRMSQYIKCNNCATFGPTPFTKREVTMQWVLWAGYIVDAWNTRKEEEDRKKDIYETLPPRTGDVA